MNVNEGGKGTPAAKSDGDMAAGGSGGEKGGPIYVLYCQTNILDIFFVFHCFFFRF